MPWTPPKFCTQRHYNPDLICELKHGHEGDHRAEAGPPIVNAQGVAIAQIVSWS